MNISTTLVDPAKNTALIPPPFFRLYDLYAGSPPTPLLILSLS